ncbi:hypothetical protein [Arthrobacter flavus]|uniref:Uncharacterized protein n=1 Tax=Arthrobacter flavus TaxID=95172 RepID=A0ABW4Q6Y7_9MICC
MPIDDWLEAAHPEQCSFVGCPARGGQRRSTGGRWYYRGDEGDPGYVGSMDPSWLNSIVLFVVFGVVFFYVLYGVIKAAVREGIKQAWQHRANQNK